ncbi:hypothetical protein Hanom_Chr12g01113151 [Helianthus anomalus]
MHLNQLANPPTPILFGGWIYRLFKNFVQRKPWSIRKGPWWGKVDLVICHSMGIINEAGDGTVRFQTVQGHVWNPQEALVLHAPQIRPPPQYQYHCHAGQSPSQGAVPSEHAPCLSPCTCCLSVIFLPRGRVHQACPRGHLL